MVEPKLQPCPFCGSADVELRVSCTDAGVACNNCGCRTGLVQLGPDAASEAYRKREVAEVWNTRTDALEAISAENAKLTELLADIMAEYRHLMDGETAQRADDLKEPRS